MPCPPTFLLGTLSHIVPSTQGRETQAFTGLTTNRWIAAGLESQILCFYWHVIVVQWEYIVTLTYVLTVYLID
jgi:hypothetical protein